MPPAEPAVAIPTALAWAHPVVQEWFVSKFGTPTEPQEGGWPSIVAGAPLATGASAGARTTERDHLYLQSFSSGPRQVVTWLRKGHTCVLSGVGVSRGQLLQLATWRAHGELPY